MAVHIAANTGCNLGCEYCYEEPDREMKEETIDNEYDIDLILERLEQFREDYPHIMPGMHGGEPLLLPIDDLETIYEWIDENYDHLDGTPHIQTNGTLLREEHLELFEKYDVSIGISMDGPEELNDSRIARAGGEDVTRKMTHQTYETIERVIEHDTISCGIIIVASKTNCGDDEKLEKLLDWIDWLNENGISGHYNPALPYEDVQEDLSLSPERLKEVWLRTWEWMKEEDYRTWDPMRGYQSNLLGHTINSCVNNKCDVYNAQSAKIIRGDGATSACGKTWGTVGDGVPFLQGPSSGNEYQDDTERYDMLKQVPGPYSEEVQNGEVEDQGGCKGCKYWSICTGGCPGGAMDYDYRNRVLWCPAIYALYERIEKDMRVMFPEIRLVTDAVEDARTETLDITEQISHTKVTHQPFAAYRPETAKNPRMGVGSALKDDVEDSVLDEILKRGSFDTAEDAKRAYTQRYDEEIISVDDETDAIHADSGASHVTERQKELRQRGATWEKVTDSSDDDDDSPGSGSSGGWQTPGDMSKGSQEDAGKPGSAEASASESGSGSSSPGSSAGWQTPGEMNNEGEETQASTGDSEAESDADEVTVEVDADLEEEDDDDDENQSMSLGPGGWEAL